MERFKKDKIRLLDINKLIEEVQFIISTTKFEDFVKGGEAREKIVCKLREVGVAAKQLSEEFKLIYGNIDWNFLLNLQSATYNEDNKAIDPSVSWYIVENDFPIIKEYLFEITSVLEDKANDAFYI